MRAHSKAGQPKTGYATAAAFALLLAGLLHAAPVSAQESGAPGGFRNEPDKPIEVEADALEVQDTERTATFTGNVRVVQGDIRMKADRIAVHYAGGKSGGSRIQKIAASGNVLISAPDNQTASGDWANYMVATRQIEMGNSVVLRQGENVIRGSRLSVNLDSGQARVSGGENGGTGRVKGLFQPRSQPSAE
ncbi:MAG: lipopolysaccharide transport periplasmic protein LptA [Alphaproteobacteria bacterium HGW-Alphaproteobacteria-3]|nr:MAG: lipopolysaccharide transport periplasmic protein LptA [Alphaproteobacteria bacterium HGW-Alphaproteobacteria-3]